MGGERIGDVGEDGLIAGVLARYGPNPPQVRIGPGDDAAVLDLSGPVVVSTDTLVEGKDFRLDWSSARDVGVKTAAQNLADVAAMGGRPVALLVSLAVGPDVPTSWAHDLAEGLDDETRRAGAAVVGGDVAESDRIVVTGTALGVLPGPAVRRSGARPGDVVAISGRTGPSGAGWALLVRGAVTVRGTTEGTAGGDGESEGDDVLAALVGAHRAPRPDYPAGPAAAQAGATAMIDTSDGLLRDVTRVARASGVVIDLDVDALAPGDDLRHAARSLGDSDLALAWVLTGGEDHALVACFPPGVALPGAFRVVGRVLARGADDDAPVTVGGRAWAGPTGWQHFGRPSTSA